MGLPAPRSGADIVGGNASSARSKVTCILRFSDQKARTTLADRYRHLIAREKACAFQKMMRYELSQDNKKKCIFVILCCDFARSAPQ
jgi:hypothetical protein